jgi:hypothetical protein
MLHLGLFITSLYVQIKILRNPDDVYMNPTAEYEEKCLDYKISLCYNESLHISKNIVVNEFCTCGFKDYFDI